MGGTASRPAVAKLEVGLKMFTYHQWDDTTPTIAFPRVYLDRGAENKVPYYMHIDCKGDMKARSPLLALTDDATSTKTWIRSISGSARLRA